jgi:transposase
MMGEQLPQDSLFSYQVNLEKRVPADHPLRRVRQAVDFWFVRGEVAHCYGHNGNESVAPEVILKMMFLLFFEDIASERELMRTLPVRLDYLWFLGYGLDDPIPDHSVLSKARRRWGREVFERLFVQTVQQCVGAGLVDGQKIHLDSSLVTAHASNNSVVKGAPALIAALKQVYHVQEQKLDEPDAALVNATVLSTTDPDATVVRQGGGGPRARYKNHRAVDDAHGVITAVLTTTGRVDEGQQLPALIEQHQQHTATAVRTAVADSKYGTVQNYRHCQQRGIRTHMADLQTQQGATGRRAGIFPESAFRYEAGRDTFVCPAGQRLSRHHWHAGRRLWEYRARPGVCAGCALRAQCTRAKDGRSLKLHEAHELVETARVQANSVAARRDRRRRQHLMERSFADAANNHGFKRARWRRLWRQQIQDWLIAAIQNVRILLAHPLRPVHTVAAALRAPVSARWPGGTRLYCLRRMRLATGSASFTLLGRN